MGSINAWIRKAPITDLMPIHSCDHLLRQPGTMDLTRRTDVLDLFGQMPVLAVTNSRSNGLMKRLGMMETFARNSIWALQKTIYLVHCHSNSDRP
jgi:hypothetical protein